jgi:hypothetical protein
LAIPYRRRLECAGPSARAAAWTSAVSRAAPGLPPFAKAPESAETRDKLAQEFELLAGKICRLNREPGHVAAWPRQARDEAGADRVRRQRENDRRHRGRLLRDFPHGASLRFRQAASVAEVRSLRRFTVSLASQSAAAAADTRRSNSMFASASRTPPLPTHSAIALVVNA